VRIHLGHHFYGAGNLGDDFMLAGFLGAMRAIEPAATFTCCVPFSLAPLQQRFPAVAWLPYDRSERIRCINTCDLWLGLGGSPFQSAHSRWFVNHLVEDAGSCARGHKPMFFLGVGVQTAAELRVPDVGRVCAQSAGIWTRDPISTERIRALPSAPPVETAADLAHVLFRAVPPPAAKPGRVTLVPNFDFGVWTGQAAFLQALRKMPAKERVWLAQESRELPGAERALHARLPAPDRAEWDLVSPETPGAAMAEVMTRWPSGEWLLTARYHAALAGAWAGSKIVVLSTNEKLRAAAGELNAPLISPEADADTVTHALERASAVAPPHALAERAQAACAALVRSAVAHQR
jgi:polysaccharide pyruvyl transferase WcaK-like protein